LGYTSVGGLGRRVVGSRQQTGECTVRTTSVGAAVSTSTGDECTSVTCVTPHYPLARSGGRNHFLVHTGWAM